MISDNNSPSNEHSSSDGSMRSALTASPEMELLLCTSRTILTERHADRIAYLADAGLDWGLLSQLAGQHKIVPLLHCHLLRAHRDILPADVARQLSQAHLLNVSTNLVLATAVPKLLALFEKNAIQAVPYKGLEIAMIAYGDLTLRHIGDVDIMTTSEDYPRASELLLSEGYEILADWGWERVFADPSGHIKIDVHRTITIQDLPIDIDLAHWRGRLSSFELRGNTIPRLPLNDLLIVMCIQVAKDGWVGRCELKKLCDIAELIRAHPNLDWRAAIKEAEQLGCRRILFLGLLLAHELLDAPLSEHILQKIRAERQLEYAGRHLVRGLAAAETTSEFSEEDQDRFASAIRERWRDRWRPRYHRFRRSLIPNELDHAFVHLPDWLHALYYLIRPLRLLRDTLFKSTGTKTKP